MGLLTSPLALLLAAALAFGGVQTWRLERAQTTIAERDVIIAQRDVRITEQNASIGTYKQQALNQKTLVDIANADAKKAGAHWKARLAKAEAERPPAADTYAGPLQMCLGTVEWMRSQYNRLAEEWNNAK